MTRFFQFALALAFLTLPPIAAKGDPWELDFELEDVQGRPCLFISASNSRVSVRSAATEERAEAQQITQVHEQSYQVGRPGVNIDNPTWLGVRSNGRLNCLAEGTAAEEKPTWMQTRSNRRLNLTGYHLYGAYSDTGEVLGYADLARMTTKVGQGGYDPEKFPKIVKLWRDLDINDANNEQIGSRGLANLLPFFPTGKYEDPQAEELRQSQQVEALGIIREMAEILAPHFPVPSAHKTKLAALPEDWPLRLARIERDAQRALFEKYQEERTSVKYQAAAERYQALLQGEEESPAHSIMSWGEENEQFAHHMVGLYCTGMQIDEGDLLPADPTISLLERAGYDRAPDYPNFFDRPTDIMVARFGSPADQGAPAGGAGKVNVGVKAAATAVAAMAVDAERAAAIAKYMASYD